MRIHAAINERAVRRIFREQKPGRSGLTVIDKDLPAFGMKVSKNGARTFFVCLARKLGTANVVLGTTDEIAAAEAREKVIAAIAAAKAEREAGPLFTEFAADFMRRQGRRWKPSTREGEYVFPNRKGDGPMKDLGLRWQKLRGLAGLDGLRIHDCRHTWASQGVMNGVGLTTVGRLLGHRQRETTAIYAHLDDGALRDAAAQAAAVIARAMGYRAEPPPLPNDTEHRDVLAAMSEFSDPEGPSALKGKRTPGACAPAAVRHLNA